MKAIILLSPHTRTLLLDSTKLELFSPTVAFFSKTHHGEIAVGVSEVLVGALLHELSYSIHVPIPCRKVQRTPPLYSVCVLRLGEELGERHPSEAPPQ